MFAKVSSVKAGLASRGYQQGRQRIISPPPRLRGLIIENKVRTRAISGFSSFWSNFSGILCVVGNDFTARDTKIARIANQRGIPLAFVRSKSDVDLTNAYLDGTIAVVNQEAADIVTKKCERQSFGFNRGCGLISSKGPKLNNHINKTHIFSAQVSSTRSTRGCSRLPEGSSLLRLKRFALRRSDRLHYAVDHCVR